MKLRKKIILCFIIVVLTAVVLLISRRPKDYIVEYEVDGYKIVEKYYKKYNLYSFFTTVNDEVFNIVVVNNYVHTKKNIKSILSLGDDDTNCIYMKSEIFNTYPICKKDNVYIAYTSSNLIDNNFYKPIDIKTVNETFGNININFYNNKKIAIWNHYGFDYLSSNNKKNISLLKEESYRDNYSFIVNNYVILPNYDEEYNFSKVYVLDLKSSDVKVWDLDLNISYDFYILGIKDNKVYVVDKKNKIEYELVPSRKKISIVSNNGIGKIWNGKWQEESMIKLSNGDYEFKNHNPINYKIMDNKLYFNVLDDDNDILISNREVDRIIKVDNLDVYYISKEELYYFSFITGEILCLKYSELDFNKGISIYIY